MALSFPDIWGQLVAAYGPAAGKADFHKVYPETFWDQIKAVLEQGSITGDGVYVVTDPQFGAVGDGVTDDTAAIQAAIDAAEAAGGGTVIAPPGTYIFDALTITESVNVIGSGRGVTTLRAAAGSGAANLVRIGNAPGSSVAVDGVILADMTIDCASTALVGVYLATAKNVTLRGLKIKSAVSHGIDSSSSTALENSLCEKNSIYDLDLQDIGGDAVKWNGQRESFIAGLHMQNITGNGLHYYPYIEGTSPSLHAVSVYHTATGIQAFGIGGDALICDTMQRSAISDFVADGVGGAGIRFSTSGPDNAVALGSNSVSFSNVTLRYCDGGGVIMDEGATVDRAKFANLTILGQPGGDDDIFGIRLRGARYVQFTNTEVFAVSSTGVKIEDGSPRGVPTESQDITFNGLQVVQCGASGSAESHGVSIQDGSFNVRVTNATLANSQTTGSNYEVSAGGGVGYVHLSGVHGTPNGGSSNFWGIGSGAEDRVWADSVRIGSSAYSPTIASAATLTIPPAQTVLLTGSTTVDNITIMPDGWRVTFLNSDAGNIQFTQAAGGSGQILHLGGANVTVGTNKIITLVCRGAAWYSER